MTLQHHYHTSLTDIHLSAFTVILWDESLQYLSADRGLFAVDTMVHTLKSIRFMGTHGECVVISTPEVSKPFICLGLGKSSSISQQTIRSGFAACSKFCQKKNIDDVVIVYPSTSTQQDSVDWLKAAVYGLHMGVYQCQKYKHTTADTATYQATIHHYHDIDSDIMPSIRAIDALVDGNYLAKDLMHAPPNILYPMAFADKMMQLTTYGCSVNVLDEAALTQENMHSLLAVGKGSSRESALVTIFWPGRNPNTSLPPIALVGKGICYDSGGINLKSSMQVDMKYDMGGAACVAGTMLALAKQQCPYPVVGVLALAENMPDGNATRPSDILQSRNGQTISVLNTDAEGRLVLADAIDYCIDTFSPRCVIDLATLTGAMIVSLGHEYAGLFSNDDDLATSLLHASTNSGEKLWRMPLDKAYDKMIDSPIADVANLGTPGGVAGSITAAQFIGRFSKTTPWAHIDIAGTAWIPGANALHAKGPTGYGVELLTQFCLYSSADSAS